VAGLQLAKSVSWLGFNVQSCSIACSTFGFTFFSNSTPCEKWHRDHDFLAAVLFGAGKGIPNLGVLYETSEVNNVHDYQQNVRNDKHSVDILCKTGE